MPDYRTGATREEEIVVGNDHAITFLGPEGPRVLSTPRMIGLMEGTFRNLVLGMLDPGHDTVGTHVNVYHLAAAPMGATVKFCATFTGVEKRRVRFDVKAVMCKPGEPDVVIGDGTHERAVIEVARFKQKVEG